MSKPASTVLKLIPIASPFASIMAELESYGSPAVVMHPATDTDPVMFRLIMSGLALGIGAELRDESGKILIPARR
jgi:hypothetical protein